jgi:hypothetical protein
MALLAGHRIPKFCPSAYTSKRECSTRRTFISRELLPVNEVNWQSFRQQFYVRYYEGLMMVTSLVVGFRTPQSSATIQVTTMSQYRIILAWGNLCDYAAQIQRYETSGKCPIKRELERERERGLSLRDFIIRTLNCNFVISISWKFTTEASKWTRMWSCNHFVNMCKSPSLCVVVCGPRENTSFLPQVKKGKTWTTEGAESWHVLASQLWFQFIRIIR